MSNATKERIRLVARERFARDGFERTTIRAVASDAGVDGALVMRYFGNKRGLFAVAAEFDLRLPDPSMVPEEHVGEGAIRFMLARWEQDDALQALLRAGATDEATAHKLRDIFMKQVLATVLRFTNDEEEAGRRAALAASQALGIALTRYVLRFAPIAEMTHDEIAAWAGPTMQRYLVGDPPRPSSSTSSRSSRGSRGSGGRSGTTSSGRDTKSRKRSSR